MGAPGIKVSSNRTVTVADVLPFRPPIGIFWPRSGGRHVGVFDDHALVMGPIACAEMTWSDAEKWARSLRVGAHADFVLPTVMELFVMIRELPSQFAVKRLWSSDPVQDVPADAWVFDILTDGPVPWGRHFTSFAVAVRRESTKHWRSP